MKCQKCQVEMKYGTICGNCKIAQPGASNCCGAELQIDTEFWKQFGKRLKRKQTAINPDDANVIGKTIEIPEDFIVSPMVPQKESR